MNSIDNRHHYILAVSGGGDSMAMLHMMSCLEPRPDMTVVTINHGLRPESVAECDMVVDYCSKLNIPCVVEHIDVLSYCQQHKVSIEHGARQLRRDILEGHAGDYICLAHNSDDSVESILMNICRGTGSTGLVGIAHLGDVYIRPVIQYTKQQLTQYCIDHNVPYVCDQSNDDTVFTRNYVRHEVIPTLLRVNSKATEHILDMASMIECDQQYIDSTIDYTLVKLGQGVAEIPLSMLQGHRAVAYRVAKYAITALLGNSVDFGKKHYDSIILLSQKVSGKKIVLPFDIIAHNDYNKVSIVLHNNTTHTAVQPQPLVLGRTHTPLGDIVVSDIASANSLRYDANKLPYGAVLRTMEQGDMFTKFGGGTKPLRRYLTDRKIPCRDRHDLLVVAVGSTVLIICGVEISDQVRIDDNTTSIKYITHHRGQK